MRWPWYQEKQQEPCPSEDARLAAEHARRALADARNFEVRASRVTTELEMTLHRNHFGIAVKQAMRGE